MQEKNGLRTWRKEKGAGFMGDLLGKMNSRGVTKPAPFSKPEFERFYK